MQNIKILIASLCLLFTSIHPNFAQGETCATAVSVSPGSHTADGPATGGGNLQANASNSDWYVYSATNDGTISVSACDGGADTRLWLYSGDCSNLTDVSDSDDACSDGTGTNFASALYDVPVTSGTDYYMEWDDRWSTDGFDWELTFTAAPTCTLPTASFSAGTCSVGNSSVDIDITDLGNGAPYTLSDDQGTATMSISATGTFSYGNYSDGTAVSLTLSSDADPTGCLVSASVSITCPPSNDECNDAILISCGDALSSSTVDATFDNPLGSDCGSGGTGANNIWYYFDGNDEEVTLDLCNSSYDTRIDVYETTGTDCSSLSCVGGNDDSGTCSTSGLRSEIIFNAYSGQRYYIAVHGFSTSTGNTTIEMSCSALCLPTPSNDDCSSATTLSMNSTLENEDNTCASTALTNPSCDNYGTIKDLWYTFNSGSNNIIYIHAGLGTATNMEVALYELCGNTAILCEDNDSDGEYIDSYVSANTDYLIQVWSSNDEAGTFDILVSDSPIIYEGSGSCESVVATATVDGSAPGSWVDVTANNEIIMQIENSVNLGQVNVSLLDHNSVPNNGYMHYLGRIWGLTCANYPNGNTFPSDVNMRLFFLDDELQELVDATNNTPIEYNGSNETAVGSVSDLNISHIPGSSDDCVTGNSEGTPSVILASGSGSYLGHHYIELATPSFSKFAIHGSNNAAALPVELLSFDGYAEGRYNVLYWETATEIQNSHFEIHRSWDGQSFDYIGRVEGQGDSQEPTLYQFVDEQPREHSYYRLKQIDFDGGYEFSPIILVENGSISNSSMVIAPNPVIDVLHIKDINEDSNIMIYNAQGILVGEYLSYENQLEVNTQHLSDGIYIIVQTNAFQHVISSQKFVKKTD